jgi:GAF domain-containing protein
MYWAALAVVLIVLAFWLGRKYAHEARDVITKSDEPDEIANLKAVNALLRTLAGTSDITRSLFELALRIRALVPCDRVGLALLTEDRQGYSTYTARIDLPGTTPEPQPDVHFSRGVTLIDEVVEAREGRVVEDVTELAPRFLDANVLRTAGFASLLLLPLIFEGEAFGTLNLVARRPGAFSHGDLHTLRPTAEVLATAYGTRRLANQLARHQMANELSDLTFAFANDMSGAIQAIIGQCELLAKQFSNQPIEQEMAGMLQQARRLSEILNQMQRMTREHAQSAARPQ